jgi:polyisoprenoid-binding protein YceI
MNIKYTLIPVAAIAGFGAYMAFHPGVAYAEPSQVSQIKPTKISSTGNYTIDPMHTSIYFQINHMGLTNVHGRFGKFEGKIVQGGSGLEKSSVEFTALTNSIDTNVAPRDTHLKSKDFFEVETYPTLTFKSTKSGKWGVGYVAVGDLKIKDVTKQVRIPFRYFGPLPGSGDQPERIGIIADPITINRRDYNINYGNNLPNGIPAIGDVVTIRLAVEATRDK